MADKFVYTITTGRSGTAYLAELVARNVPDAAVFHERVNYDSFGVHTPDVSHLMLFNTLGNVRRVRTFWRVKLAADRGSPRPWYVESSHMLAKAGLVENLRLLHDQGGQTHLVILRRRTSDIVGSLLERGDFRFLGGHTWLHWLDPRYRNRILDSRPFVEHGELGIALWYVMEIAVRAEYYKLLLAGQPGVHVHEVTLDDIAEPHGAGDLLADLGMLARRTPASVPPRQNGRGTDTLPEAVRDRSLRFCDSWSCDAPALARRYFDSGARLGDGASRSAGRARPIDR